MTKKVRKILLFLTMLLIVVGVVMLFFPIMLVADTNPNNITWDPGDTVVGAPFHCPECHGPGGSTVELRIQSGDKETGTINGVHTDGVFTVTVTGDTGNTASGFSWTSNIPACYLIVKAGSTAYGYSLSTDYLTGSWSGVPGTGSGISHISFCYDPTPPTTTTTQGTTTTTQGTTTTTEGTTTTTQGTTTTVTEQGDIEVLALTGYNSLWYVAGSVLIALGIIMGTFSLSTALKRR